MDWALIFVMVVTFAGVILGGWLFVMVVTFAGVILGGWLGEKLEDWWSR